MQMSDWKFQAALQGIDIDKVLKGKDQSSEELFGDPESYKNMSEEERKELTEKMKKRVASLMGPSLKGKKR